MVEIDLMKVGVVDFKAHGAIGVDVHGQGEDHSFLAEHRQLSNKVLLFMVVDQEILRFGNYSD